MTSHAAFTRRLLGATLPSAVAMSVVAIVVVVIVLLIALVILYKGVFIVHQAEGMAAHGFCCIACRLPCVASCRAPSRFSLGALCFSPRFPWRV